MLKLSSLDIKFQICGGTMHFYKSDGVQIAFHYGNMGLSSLQGRDDTKLDRFLAKNQYSKTKLLYFVN